LKLYESDKDIISGAYLLANGQVVAYKELFKSPLGYIEVLNMKEPIKVHGIGFGFVAVKQGVFESITRPWFQQAVATMQNEDGTEYQFPIMGEDISWCERVKAQGYDIWFDPEVRVTHHKMMTLSWEGIQP
jgi:GT2 family glycosyltransferase